jgi:hypothetical protein
MAVQCGLSPLEALLISMTNLTSAGQMAGTPIIASGGSFVELAMTQLIINSRYALMSVALSQKLRSGTGILERMFIAFANTDEIFAVAMDQKESIGEKYFVGLMSAPWIGWSSGTIIGALAGAAREQFFGRLMRFEGLKCHYAGVANHEGKTAPAIKNGSYDNIYPSWMYTDPRPTVSQPWYRWAFRETDYTADGEEYATGRSLYGSVLFTYRDDLLSQKAGDAGMQGSQDGVYVVRTSGYSRFANRPLCKDEEEATITAFYGIYSKQSDYTGGDRDYASYQLTLNRYEDMEFTNGDAAFLSEEQVKALTTDDMKYVPWIDEEGEIGD